MPLAALVLLAGGAQAGVTDFYGHWENVADGAGGLTHVVISPDGGNRVNVRAYGNCHPVECNWGQVAGRSYAADPRSDVVDTISAVFNAAFARRQIVLRPANGGRLTFELLTEFPDGAGPHDFVVRGTLRPSSWAGPISENWERPAEEGTGWGGGARSAVPAVPKEACSAFDPAAVRTVPRNGKWQVVAGNLMLAEAGDKRVALEAESTVKFYRFDRRCFAGDAAGTYWKRGADFPDYRMGSADCLGFNPTTAHVVHIGQSWKVVDGTAWLAEFGENRTRAEALLALIRLNRLDTQCFVGRPDPAMVYWLSL